MIVADTGAVVALVDRDDAHHEAMLAVYESDPDGWVLPWAILPEVDYLLFAHVGDEAGRVFARDLAAGAWAVEWGVPADLARAAALLDRHADLRMGLVDAVVMATAERLGAAAIATLDLRDFGAVELSGSPRLLPREA